jgi:hypothetical protein
LFTQGSIDDYLSNLFEAACKPLLIYIQEVYGSPIQLSGLPSPNLTSSTPSTEIIFKGKNFNYDKHRSYDYESSRVFRIMQSINKKFNRTMKNSYTTTLTVHIPKDPNHPFWNIDRPQRRDDSEMFTWVASDDSVSFQVQRWGPYVEYANYYATQRAKDIIWNIRLGVSGTRVFGRPAVFRISRFPASCPAFSLGVQLQNIWRAGAQGISTVQFAIDAVNTIQQMIEKNTLASLGLLLTYYQVNVRLVY